MKTVISRQFPLVDQIRDAADNRARARILLRASDTVIMHGGNQVRLACIRAQFRAGADFIDCRVSALMAVRDEHGLLPEDVAGQLEAWRRTMSQFSAGGGDDSCSG